MYHEHLAPSSQISFAYSAFYISTNTDKVYILKNKFLPIKQTQTENIIFLF